MFNFDNDFDFGDDMLPNYGTFGIDESDKKQYEEELAEMRANCATEDELWCFEMYHLIHDMMGEMQCLIE